MSKIKNLTPPAIEKLRAIKIWADYHDEHFLHQFKTISQLERLFDYSCNKNIEFMDDSFLLSGEIDPKEAKKALNFIKEVKKNQSQIK